MSAASNTKRGDPGLVVLEQGEWVSYDACGPPYYIKVEIQSLENFVSEYGEGAVHWSHALVGAVTEGIAVDDLSNCDLADAPPFNTTWDLVLTAAKVVDGSR